jgi:hypothetical protein
MTGLGPLTTLIPCPSCTSSFANVYITTMTCSLDFGLLYFCAPTYTGPPVTWKNTYRECASAFSSLSADATWASNEHTFTFAYNNSGDFNAFGVQVRFQSFDIAGVTSVRGHLTLFINVLRPDCIVVDNPIAIANDHLHLYHICHFIYTQQD